jgi:predicted phage tail protein
LFLPASPTGLTATGGNAQALLSWTAPTGVIAQAPVTDYREQYSSDNGTTWTTFTAAASTATSATVTGLTNGTAYVFRVAAINGVGAGAYTSASSSVTPTAGTPPNAPTSLTATAGNAQIALAWTAPSAPGTSAISGYTVEYTPSGGSAQTVSTGSTGTTYTLTGLTNGTAYTVRVAGVSAAGTGAYSGTASGTPNAATVMFNGFAVGVGSASNKMSISVGGNTVNRTAAVSGTVRITGTITDIDGFNGNILVNGVQRFSGDGNVDITTSITSGQVVSFQIGGAISALLWIE